ncbi:MAG TPA: hypothetical protein VG318_18710 [Actinomycetota bacterium]|nr:hypothetical protein [Actinomycetota bacterium]
MERTEPIRELFIEELTDVTGGTNPLEKLGIWQWLREQLVTTHACGEEGPSC